jgi:hypothetical protein
MPGIAYQVQASVDGLRNFENAAGGEFPAEPDASLRHYDIAPGAGDRWALYRVLVVR